MKAKTLILLSFIIFSCGSRTKQTEKTKINTSYNSDVSKTENTEFKSIAEAQTDLSKFLKQSGLKINSVGKPYQLQYNGVVFSGDANLDFSNSEEKTTIKTIRKENLTYKSKMAYKSLTHHRTIYHKKDMNLKSERSSWWLYALIVVVSIGVWELAKNLLKKYNPLKYFKW